MLLCARVVGRILCAELWGEFSVRSCGENSLCGVVGRILCAESPRPSRGGDGGGVCNLHHIYHSVLISCLKILTPPPTPPLQGRGDPAQDEEMEEKKSGEKMEKKRGEKV